MPTIISRIGETNVSIHNLKMTIIDYRGANDIDIQFDDGTIVKNRSYENFKKGHIRNPNCKKGLLKSQFVGETILAHNGQKMTIIAFRDSTDIDVQFEDNTIVKNKTYYAFQKASIRNPNLKPVYSQMNRTGEINTNNQGLKMEIVGYRNTGDIDVKFSDGYISEHKQYDAFKKGKIKNPNYSNEKIRINETRINNQGLTMTILEYRSCNDIDIIFEDNTIVTNKTYKRFVKGEITHPDYKTPFYEKVKTDYIGTTNIASNGQKMTIIRYNTAHDLDIQFEDGTIVHSTSVNNFKRGLVKNPYCLAKRTKIHMLEKHIGETRKANNGQMMTIIDYRGQRDIDIQFEDNTIVYHKTYTNFKKGQVRNPNFRNKQNKRKAG